MKPQTARLIVGELKHEIVREPFGVAFHSQIQRLGRNAVEFRQIGIEHDLLTADQKYSPLDLNRQRLGFHRSMTGSQNLGCDEGVTDCDTLSLNFWLRSEK